MSPIIPKGHELIPGRGKATATVALAAAEKAGLSPQSVRTVAEGYVVPAKVATEFTKLVDAEAKSKPKAEPKAMPKASDDAEEQARVAQAKADADAKAAADQAEADQKAKAEADAKAKADADTKKSSKSSTDDKK